MARILAISNNRPKSFQSMEAFIMPDKKSDIPYFRDYTRRNRDENKKDRLLPNTIGTRTKATFHKYADALSIYPAKGFAGSKNSNFYEFLAMGMFPYVAGSLTFIALFNGVTKYFVPKSADKAKKYGFGMALGVVFYALAKGLAQKAISKPVAMKTGIDMDQPYMKVVNLVQTPEEVQKAKEERIRKEINGEVVDKDEDSTGKAFEFHSVFESVDFPRTDLLYNKRDYKKRNEVYDKIAEKNGFGTNLPDSDQEVRPFIKSVVTKAKTAQTISQYLWAAIGVGLGVQEPWQKVLELFKPGKLAGMTLGRRTKTIYRTVKKSFKDSCKTFWNGGVEGAINKSSRTVGRALLGAAVISTVWGVINAVKNPYMKNNEDMKSSTVFNDRSKVEEE